MKLKEDVIGQRRRLAKYIKRLQRFASVFVDFWLILGGTLECSFGSVFGPSFEHHFWVCFWVHF
jgi:hypothetical protein